MTESGLIDVPPERRASDRRWLLPVVLVLALLAVPLLAAWIHFGRVHSDDVDAFSTITRDLTEADTIWRPVSHTDTPPCQDGPTGYADRVYPESSEATAGKLIEKLMDREWTELSSPTAFARLTKTVNDRELVIDIDARSRDSKGLTLRATSPGSRWSCLLR